mmetsp:Transcript_32725/g.79524  ORF Transcript_32725/g.79524 Transcript_32725/m.79524 type:complete len:221 (+) Transcript_32725:439-1101(+)
MSSSLPVPEMYPERSGAKWRNIAGLDGSTSDSKSSLGDFWLGSGSIPNAPNDGSVSAALLIFATANSFDGNNVYPMNLASSLADKKLMFKSVPTMALYNDDEDDVNDCVDLRVLHSTCSISTLSGLTHGRCDFKKFAMGCKSASFSSDNVNLCIRWGNGTDGPPGICCEKVPDDSTGPDPGTVITSSATSFLFSCFNLFCTCSTNALSWSFFSSFARIAH